MNLDKALFHQYVNEEEKPLLAEFMAPWCTYCRRLAVTMEAVAKQYGDTLNIGFVNIDEEPELEEQEAIELVPTLILYHKGKRLGNLVNPDSKAKIDSFIAQTLGK